MLQEMGARCTLEAGFWGRCPEVGSGEAVGGEATSAVGI